MCAQFSALPHTAAARYYCCWRCCCYSMQARASASSVVKPLLMFQHVCSYTCTSVYSCVCVSIRLCMHMFVYTYVWAGAVQDLDAGVIVGLGKGKTYGKGLVQSIKVSFYYVAVFTLALFILSFILCAVMHCWSCTRSFKAYCVYVRCDCLVSGVGEHVHWHKYCHVELPVFDTDVFSMESSGSSGKS
jgi:hypothetical protein